ncbi:hypothetical protein H0H93_002875 [Arthromyces matolae]|nr:hypothetical protein H0H93_002875 [Arthromyces matolae]
MGKNAGDKSLQGVALEARAGEKVDVPQAGPSNTGGKRRDSSSRDTIPPPHPSTSQEHMKEVEDLAERVLRKVLQFHKEEKQEVLSQYVYFLHVTSLRFTIGELMGVKKFSWTVPGGDSKGSEGGRSGDESPKSRNSSFSHSCSSCEDSEGGSSIGKDDETLPPDLFYKLADLKVIHTWVIDGLEKDGLPPQWTQMVQLATCVARKDLIADYKQREEGMGPAEKRQKTDK